MLRLVQQGISALISTTVGKSRPTPTLPVAKAPVVHISSLVSLGESFNIVKRPALIPLCSRRRPHRKFQLSFRRWCGVSFFGQLLPGCLAAACFRWRISNARQGQPERLVLRPNDHRMIDEWHPNDSLLLQFPTSSHSNIRPANLAAQLEVVLPVRSDTVILTTAEDKTVEFSELHTALDSPGCTRPTGIVPTISGHGRLSVCQCQKSEVTRLCSDRESFQDSNRIPCLPIML